MTTHSRRTRLTSLPARLSGVFTRIAGSPARLLSLTVPQQWPQALRAAAEIVLGSWLVVLVPVVAVYAVSSTHDAAAALNLGSVVRTGTGLWSLGLGGAYGAPTDPAGALELPLLGLTALIVALAYPAVRRAHFTDTVNGALCVVASMLMMTAVLLVAGPAHAHTWPAIVWMGVLTAAVITHDAMRCGRVWEPLTQWWQRRPDWTTLAAVLVRDCALLLTACAVIALVAATTSGAGRVARLHDSLTSGAIIASLGLILLELAWLPTIMIWAAAWCVGSGFSVGTGTSFTPDQVIAGAVPTLPMLGLLPTNPIGGQGASWGVWVPLVLTVGAMGVMWLRRRRLAALDVGQVVLATIAAALLFSLIVGFLCLAASGSIGPGRLTNVGPRTGMTVLLLAVEIGVGLLAAGLALHPWTYALTQRGVRASAAAASAAAGGARERMGGHVHAVRVRSSLYPQSQRGQTAMSDVQTTTQESTATPLVVLISGTGSNLAALLQACEDPAYGARIVGVVADKDCAGLRYAHDADVPTAVVPLGDYPDRTAWNEALTDAIAQWEPQLVVCAGFMRLLGQPVLARYGGSIINTHPSLLPDFPGAHAVRDALAAGATLTGASLFWVDEGVDTGKLIAQVEVPVHADDTEDSLTARIKAAETPQLVEQVGILARAR